MKTRVGTVLSSLCFFGATALAWPATVDACFKPGDPWQSYPTRTLAELPADSRSSPAPELSEYGGLRSRRVKATGFFYPAKVDGRWWLIDPGGCLFLHQAVCSVTMLRTEGALAAWRHRWGSETNWVGATAQLLKHHGFNGVGAWSDAEALSTATPRLV